MIIIGEKINGTRKKIKEAIANRDKAFIQDLALRQVKAGASYLDVNSGTSPEKEPEDIIWLINSVQEVTDVTLCLDSTNPKALSAGIGAINRKLMINSLSGEKKSLEEVLPLVCEHQTELIMVPVDDSGIPNNVEKRLEIIHRLIGMTRNGGLADEKLYIDPLVTAISTDIKSGNVTFDTIGRIRKEFPKVHISAALSNISFGLPVRSTINQAFAVLAISAGIDTAIMDPEDIRLLSIIYAADTVLGRDRYCRNFTSAYRAGIIGEKK
jgi:5-methyltetrahydrofolate--homocysteine methyltransferase